MPGQFDNLKRSYGYSVPNGRPPGSAVEAAPVVRNRRRRVSAAALPPMEQDLQTQNAAAMEGSRLQQEGQIRLAPPPTESMDQDAMWSSGGRESSPGSAVGPNQVQPTGLPTAQLPPTESMDQDAMWSSVGRENSPGSAVGPNQSQPTGLPTASPAQNPWLESMGPSSVMRAQGPVPFSGAPVGSPLSAPFGSMGGGTAPGIPSVTPGGGPVLQTPRILGPQPRIGRVSQGIPGSLSLSAPPGAGISNMTPGGGINPQMRADRDRAMALQQQQLQRSLSLSAPQGGRANQGILSSFRAPQGGRANQGILSSFRAPQGGRANQLMAPTPMRPGRQRVPFARYRNLARGY